MNREAKREEANAAVRCDECAESVKAKNWEQHFSRQHPGLAVPSLEERLDDAVARLEQSHENVTGAPDLGGAGDGATGQSAEQEPIPNPADRRPSTLDTAGSQ